MPPKSSGELRFATKAIHAGQEPDKATGSVIIPIYQTSTYAQPEPGREGPYVYSRTANPTRTALEENLAALENGRYGLAFSSGMAATTTILMLLSKGQDGFIESHAHRSDHKSPTAKSKTASE